MPNVRDMDLRDWFAGQVLNALLGRHHIEELPESALHHHTHTVVQRAYAYADEMLRQRATRPPAP